MKAKATVPRSKFDHVRAEWRKTLDELYEKEKKILHDELRFDLIVERIENNDLTGARTIALGEDRDLNSYKRTLNVN